MNSKLANELENFAMARLEEIEMTQSYDDLKMSLIHTELMLGDGERNSDDRIEGYDEFIEELDNIWGRVCEAAIKKAISLAEDSSSFAALLKTPAEEIPSALWDNYLWGAIAAVIAAQENPSIKQLPLLAEAAFNKHSYQGYKDEIACLRMLLWAGFDPNAQEEQGRTALHFMAALKNLPGSHPRAVRLLLKAGIDPNLQNEIGDSAMCYMAGNASWFDALTETAWLLLQNGANPLLEANDGNSAYTLWRQNRNNHQAIDDLVSTIESVMAESQA